MFPLYQQAIKPKDSPLMTRIKGQQDNPFNVIDAYKPEADERVFRDVTELKKCIGELGSGLIVIATRYTKKRGKPSRSIRLKDGCLIASVEVAGEVRGLINGC